MSPHSVGAPPDPNEVPSPLVFYLREEVNGRVWHHWMAHLHTSTIYRTDLFTGEWKGGIRRSPILAMSQRRFDRTAMITEVRIFHKLNARLYQILEKGDAIWNW